MNQYHKQLKAFLNLVARVSDVVSSPTAQTGSLLKFVPVSHPALMAVITELNLNLTGIHLIQYSRD